MCMFYLTLLKFCLDNSMFVLLLNSHFIFTFKSFCFSCIENFEKKGKKEKKKDLKRGFKKLVFKFL